MFSKIRDHMAKQIRAKDEVRLNQFIEAEAKLEQEYGVELVASMQYTDVGAFPKVMARLKPLPQNAPGTTPPAEEAAPHEAAAQA